MPNDDTPKPRELSAADGKRLKGLGYPAYQEAGKWWIVPQGKVTVKSRSCMSEAETEARDKILAERAAAAGAAAKKAGSPAPKPAPLLDGSPGAESGGTKS